MRCSSLRLLVRARKRLGWPVGMLALGLLACSDPSAREIGSLVREDAQVVVWEARISILLEQRNRTSNHFPERVALLERRRLVQCLTEALG